MKMILKVIILLSLLTISNGVLGLNCSVDVAQFLANDKPYVDVNLRLEGRTCKFILSEEGKYSSKALVEIYFKFGDQIKAFEKYELSATDLDSKGDMLDMRRFFIDAGGYKLDIRITDKNDSTNVFEYKSNVIVKKVDDFKISNALLLSKVEKSNAVTPLVRNGIYMEVLPYMVVGEDVKSVNLYQEVYRNKFSQDILIHRVDIKKINKSDNELISPPFVKYKKLADEEVIPVLTNLDLSSLTSGKYEVITSVIDKDKNELVSDVVNIIIYNTFADVKNVKEYNKVYGNTFVDALDSSEVVYALKAIIPITNYKMTSTLDQIILKGSIEAQKYYLFNHWDDTYPGLAEAGYTKYMVIARVVDTDYNASVGHGFQTDRGYYYLKYGKPSKFINVIDEPNTPPYEIWYYNYLPATNQTDVRFLFYDPLQVNNFELLHSNCYGERSNPAWETVLYKFNQDERIGHTITATEVEDNWGRKAKRLFNEF